MNLDIGYFDKDCEVQFMKKYLVIIWSFIFMSSGMGHADEPLLILTKENSPPLIWAVHQNDKDAVFRLINNKAQIDLNVTDRFERTALFLAVVGHKKEIATLLADAGADLDKLCGYEGTALHAAISINEPEIVKMLLEKGANVESKDGAGRTALHEAAFRLEIVELLLKKGANVEARDKNGETPLLLYTDGRGTVDTITLLLNAGADIRATDPQGKTPLHHAAEALENSNKPLEIIKLLIMHGADPNAVDKEGKKPLDLAKRDRNSLTKKIDRVLVPYSQAIVDYLSSKTNWW